MGVFDGVHRGHRLILKEAVKKAHRIKGTAVVLTFSTHPQKEKYIYSLEHRLRLIAGLGIDVCVVIDFNQHFAEILAQDFIRDILFKRLGARYIYVGINFRFGKYAKGNIRTLEGASELYNFKVRAFALAMSGHRPVSSTYIRTLVSRGDLWRAQELLTCPVCVLGTVIRGNSLASKLGFPTANIDPHHEVIPPSGVYAVTVIFKNKKLKGICNIGTKPTFMKTGERHIEIHIFNFKRNIYGEYLEVRFLKKIREEQKFTSAAALSSRIKKDIISAKRVISLH